MIRWSILYVVADRKKQNIWCFTAQVSWWREEIWIKHWVGATECNCRDAEAEGKLAVGFLRNYKNAKRIGEESKQERSSGATRVSKGKLNPEVLPKWWSGGTWERSGVISSGCETDTSPPAQTLMRLPVYAQKNSYLLTAKLILGIIASSCYNISIRTKRESDLLATIWCKIVSQNSPDR